MNIFKTLIRRSSLAFVALAGLTAVTTSCEKIYEGQGDCDPKYYLQFVYDMNMQFTDAFSQKVTSVEVYAFDASTGAFVKKFAESGSALAQAGYRMKVDLDPGTYEFIAWCGLENNNGHFVLNSSVSHSTDLTCLMSRNEKDGIKVQDANLTPLFHGKIGASLPDTEGEHVYTMPLIKDTNNVKVNIVNNENIDIKVSDFDVSMKDVNGSMAHDNSLRDDEEITYLPWNTTGRSSRADDANISAVQSELATARLTTVTDPMISVKYCGTEIGGINLKNLALQFKSANYASMGDQEYLDREDEYEVTIYLGNPDIEAEGPWTAIQVVINGWHVMDDVFETI